MNSSDLASVNRGRLGRARRGVAAAVLALLAPACDEDTFAPSVRYRALGYPAASAGACPEAGTDAPPAIAGATRARLTYVDAATDELRCDVVIALGEAAPVIAVPDRVRPVDLTIEYLDDAGAVLGRGAVRDVDLAATAVVDVRVAATSAFSCGLDRAAAPRALHSATLLPGGEVLLLGGVAGPGGGGDIDPAVGLFLQPTAELWIPATGEVRTASIPGLVPRAMHEAWVTGVDASGVVTIVVQGGLSVTGDAATTPALIPGASYRLAPSPSTTAPAAERLTYDPRTQTFTRAALPDDDAVAPRVFAALTGAGPALAAVGGRDLPPDNTPRSTADHLAPTTGAVTTQIGGRRARVGATVTALDANRLLVWGGDVGAGDGSGTAEVGELLASWSTSPASAPLSIDPAGEAGTHRAFHAAAVAGDGSVILGGGFRMLVNDALDVAPEVVQRVAVGAAMQTITTLLDDAAATAAGYTAAATLPDGDVLITGGNPAPGTGGCDPGANGLPCAIAQALRYDSATGAIAATGPLGVPRYGHRSTTLADGRVLVTGGLAVGATPTTLRAVIDVELYEPRGAADDPLLPAIVRAPGDVARTEGGEPLAPCEVVVRYDDAGP